MLAADGASTEPGLYACGWVKRGPTGIIGALHLLLVASNPVHRSSLWEECKYVHLLP